jgi:hypothetical protein
MTLKIGSDVDRFKQIIRNKVKNDLGKYISSENLIGQQGSKTINIPIHRIDLPRFIWGTGQGGVGQGDSLGDPDENQKGDGKGKPGENSGEHTYSAEFSESELAQILGEQLQLPKIENKGKGQINSVVNKYNGISQNGSEGLRHFKRTYKETLKRAISSGSYNASDPKLIPIKHDKRYRTPTYKEQPDCNTVVIYIMDVSGSMGTEEKYIVKSEVFWINLWLKFQYKNIESRFIVHDTEANEVDREQFFSISEAGGTKISPAYELCYKIIQEDHPFNGWNSYIFHFTDGDNWGSDNDISSSILKDKIIPNSNMFSYGQVSSGSGDFMKVLEKDFRSEEKVTLSDIKTRDDILPSIRKFLGKGK